ncbi:MAG TPA: exopolysaccharide biosynthesis protein [Microvirga sp.]
MSKARTSEILTSLAAQPGERLTVGEIIAVLRDRAFALLVVLLGLPNCLPMPPPIPLVCGLLLALVALQIIGGRSAPWLPQALLTRSIAHTDVDRAVNRAVPIFRRLERFSRPRMTVFDTGLALRLMGLLLLILALGLLFAPPFVGQIPLGIAVCLVGLGLVERDGLVVIGGLAIGSLGLTLSLGFVYAIISGIDTIL